MNITIERFKLAPSPVRSYRVSWKWTYNYHIDDGPVCQYGEGLADLRAMLKRKFQGATIIETWKQGR